MNNQAKISVLMPVYNTNLNFLKEAIDSILEQTYQNWELIILNDGSNNDIESLITQYVDSRIFYFCNECNKGIAYTRNKLLSLANGEYIAYLDSDDIAIQNRLEIQYKFLKNNPNIDICGGWLEEYPYTNIRKFPLTDEEIKYYMLFIGDVIANPTVMMKKSFIKRINLEYKKEKIEDYQVWLDFLENTTFANLPIVLTKYRIHDNQITAQYNEETQIYTEAVMARTQQRVLGYNIDFYYKIKHKKIKHEKINIEEIRKFYSSFEQIILPIIKKNQLLKKECKKIIKYIITHHFWQINEIKLLTKLIALYIRNIKL